MERDDKIVFEIRNRGGLPLPPVVVWIMIAVFSLPLILIPMTIGEVKAHPTVLLAWVGACFPLGLLYVLKRLFTRFAVALFADGSVRITQPFTTRTIPRERLATIVTKTNQANIGGGATGRVAVPWLFFFDSTDTQLEKVSPSGFDGGDVSNLLAEIQRLRPDVRIQHQ
jgi:hypothetical protein